MIEVTRENKDRSKFSINEFMINTIEKGREDKAVITMNNGIIFTVTETKEEIEKLVLEAKKKVFNFNCCCRKGF